MEDTSCNDPTHKQRILQLEQERDELRLDVEQLCMQKSGIPSKVDISSQIQARRITSLEQEMELWKQKLEACTKKNQKLQDELSEAKHIKAQFADLLKAETDKNLELDKEIKFFQSKAANALVERDRALLQVDKCLEQEKELIVKVHQLQNRLELLTSDLLEQKKCFQDLQDNTKAELEDSKRFQNVVQFFWGIRSKSCDYEHVKGLGDRATILLQDLESSWAFGDTKQLERLSYQVKESGAAMAALQEETCAAKELVVRLQRQLEGETMLKQRAQEHCLLLKQQLLHLTVIIKGKLRAIHSIMIGLKEEISTTLKEEEKCAESLLVPWLSLIIHHNPTSQKNQKLTSSNVLTRNCTDGGITEVADNTQDLHEACINKVNVTRSKHSLEQDYDSEMRDAKEALALAIQEKVALLLLLSQQEERHKFEENMVAAQESKIVGLQKQLLQVTADKGKALRQAADLSEELAKVEEQQCELQHTRQYSRNSSANNQMLVATLSRRQSHQNLSNQLEDVNAQNNDQRRASFRWPLKSWFIGFDPFGSGSGAQASWGLE
eukprot:c10251_g1_i1 orf=143-1798(+)